MLLTVWTLRTADAQLPGAPGIRAAASGVHDLDGGASPSELSYFGIWDVKANRADVFSSPQPNVTLGQLVGAIEGESGESRGMAWVIRDNRNGIRIPWSAQSHARILPGDLVVLPSDREGVLGRSSGHTGTPGVARGVPGASAATSAAGDRVQVAFVGLEPRRPMIVTLPGSHATVDHVLEQLHQPAALAPTVRVVRTDTQGGQVRGDVSPVRLVDGDVLIFDRSLLDGHGLAVARANGTFPDSRSLDLTSDAPAQYGPSTGSAWPGSAVMTFDLGPGPAGSGVAGEQDYPALLEPSAPSNAAIGLSNRPAEDGPAVMTADHYSPTESSPLSKTTGLVPAPADPLTRAARSTGDEPLASLNTLSIAVGVLVLAGLCFLASVAWTRIERSSDELPDTSASGRSRAGDGTGAGKAERKTLDQLIGNRVPMIEEQAPLPNRMDYFGPERGRKRMIIDPPHPVAGPHFAVAPAGARGERSSREPVLTAAAAPQQQEDGGPSRTEARLTRAALQIRQLRRRRHQPAANKPHEDTSNETAGSTTSGSSERTHQVAPSSNPCESTATFRPQHPGCSKAAGVLERPRAAGVIEPDRESIADHVLSGRPVRKSVLSVPPFQMGRATSRSEAQPLETQRNETQPRPTNSAPVEPKSDEPDASLPRVGLLERVLIAMERERRT